MLCAFMLLNLLRRAMIFTGKRHLVPFLDGLIYLGRPSHVPFPGELLEQGLAIVLSGLNNTVAMQSNPDWVWPHWVERQIAPDGEAFIPTAFNLIKTNLTHRNWTSLGVEDSANEAMLDPVGMLTLRPYGWSVFPYVRCLGRVHLPPRMEGLVSQSLLDGHLPAVVTRYRAMPGLRWESEALAMRVQGEEVIGFNHLLANETQRHVSLRFGLALRPYNTLMLGHINRIRYDAGAWNVNGSECFVVEGNPDRVVVSDRHHGDPLVREVLIEGLRTLRSRSGIACGLCEWGIELPPGDQREIKSLASIGNTASSRSAQAWRPSLSVAIPARLDAVRRMREAQGEGMTLKLPDAKLEEAFAAIKGHLHIFDDRDHFSPGTFIYHQPWFRDSAFIAAAFDHVGWFVRVEEKIPSMLRRQDRHGFFRSQNGEWDSNGQAMWTLVSHVRRGGSPEILTQIHPALMRGARWIHRMRRQHGGMPSPHFGLLPAGFSAEHFGPNDHYYWDNLWALAGLESALWSARALKLSEDQAWLQSEWEEYRGDLLSSMEFSLARQGGQGLPCSPYRTLDTAAIGNLVGISPLGIIPSGEPWVAATCDWLWRNNVRDGLFFQKIVHTGLNPYLSAQLARAFMAMGERRGHDMLQSLVRHATSTYTWPEALHPRTLGGCMGDGDHGWSAAETLQLIRALLIEDHADALWLLPSAPREWWKPGMHLAVDEAPSRFGKVAIKILWGTVSCIIEWDIQRAPHQDAAPARLVVPADLALHLPLPAQRLGTRTFIELEHASGRFVLSDMNQESSRAERMRDALQYQGQNP